MAVNTIDITKELKKKLGRDKSRRNHTINNNDLLAITNNQVKLPPLPDLASNSRIKEKIYLKQVKPFTLFGNLASDENRKDVKLDFKKRNEKLFLNRKTQIYINTKYEIVSEVALSKKYKLVRENDDWNVLWIDGSINAARAFSIKRHQRINHFPGMNEISRKDKLQKNLKTMQRYFPLDYEIFPKTWNLPNERMEVINYLREKRDDRDTFIIKPACSSQGRGIILISDVKSLSVIGSTICQLYISNPFLIDGFKFDLRIYVLVTSCDPFRIYVYDEGLARFATCPYEKPNSKNINNVFMHLTNYSVQRNSDKYDTNEFSGTKRRASTIYEWFKNEGYDAEAIWKSIDDVIIKTMLCANNSILHHYTATFPDQYRTSACFELLGFDIILDDKLMPFILEVNHSPSLETETPLDQEVKSSMLNDVFNLVNSTPRNVKKLSDLERLRSAERLTWSRSQYMSSRKAAREFRKVLSDLQIEMEKDEMDNRNGFRLLYPVAGQTEKYQRFFDFNCENHRNYFNRSDNRRCMDIQKDCFSRALNRSGKSSDSRTMNRTRAPYGDTYRSRSRPFKISRDGTIINNTTYSGGMLRWADTTQNNRMSIPNLPNSNANLLNNSKASLQKLIFSKPGRQNPHGDLKTNGFHILNQAKSSDPGESKKPIRPRKNKKNKNHPPKQDQPAVETQIDTTQTNSTKTSTQNQDFNSAINSDLNPNLNPNLNSNLNPDHNINMDTDEDSDTLHFHKVTEHQLNEKTSVNLEWESSLYCKKVNQVSQLVISDIENVINHNQHIRQAVSLESWTKTNSISYSDGFKGKDRGMEEEKDDSTDSNYNQSTGDLPFSTNMDNNIIDKIYCAPRGIPLIKSSASNSTFEMEETIGVKYESCPRDPIKTPKNMPSTPTHSNNNQPMLFDKTFKNDECNLFELKQLNTNGSFIDIKYQEIDFGTNKPKDKVFCSNLNSSQSFTVTESTKLACQHIGEIEDEIELMQCGGLGMVESFLDFEYSLNKVASLEVINDLNVIEIHDVALHEPSEVCETPKDPDSLSYSDFSNNTPYSVHVNQSNCQFQLNSQITSISIAKSNEASTYAIGSFKKSSAQIENSCSSNVKPTNLIDYGSSLEDIPGFDDMTSISHKKSAKFKSNNFDNTKIN